MIIANLPDSIEKLILSYIPLWWMPHGTIARIKTHINLIDGIILKNNTWNCNWFYHYKSSSFTLQYNLLGKENKKYYITEILRFSNILHNY